MSDALEVVGLLAVVVAGFLVAVWLGFGVLGVACLWSSWSMARNRRQAAEAASVRRARSMA